MNPDNSTARPVLHGGSPDCSHALPRRRHKYNKASARINGRVGSAGPVVAVQPPPLLPVNGLDLKDYLNRLERSLIKQALEDTGQAALPHITSNVTSEMVQQAEMIYCMTDGQRSDLISKFPEASVKAVRLDPWHDISDPAGKDLEPFMACARHLQSQVLMRLGELGLASA